MTGILGIGLLLVGASRAPVMVDAKARAVFATCYQEVLKTVKDCSGGECGRLLGGCYAKQLETVDADSRARLLRLGDGRCRAEADSLEGTMAALTEAVGSSRHLKERWSGMELQVEAALLRNHALKAIEEECRR